jgi:flagellar biosynthesis chaperone FliJ
MENLLDELKMVKVAHSRLLNQYKDLDKKLNSLTNNHRELERYVQEQLVELVKSQSKVTKQPFVNDNIYIETISEIISNSDEIEWNNGKYINYEIKLKDREELFTAFVSLKYRLLVGFTIKFTYVGNGKLSKIRILD